jgi:hypothetical protein
LTHSLSAVRVLIVQLPNSILDLFKKGIEKISKNGYV